MKPNNFCCLKLTPEGLGLELNQDLNLDLASKIPVLPTISSLKLTEYKSSIFFSQIYIVFLSVWQ